MKRAAYYNQQTVASKRSEKSPLFRHVLTLLAERLTLAVVCASAAMLIFAVLAHQVYEGDTLRSDNAILHAFQRHQTPFVHGLMTAFSWLAAGQTLAGIVLLCLIGAWRRSEFRPDALSMIVAVIGGEALIGFLKAVFHRPRPSAEFASLGYSFPSGHAFFAVMIYGMLAYWLSRAFPEVRRWIWLAAFALILIIGLSRIALGVHYASDVAAGFAVALPWLWGCLALPQAFGLMRREEQRSAK